MAVHEWNWASKGIVHLETGGTLVDQGSAELQRLFDEYPFARLPPHVWQHMNIGVDAPMNQFCNKIFNAVKGIPTTKAEVVELLSGTNRADFMQAFRETWAVADMLVDLDAPLMEHRMQQVMTSAALTDAADAATAFGDVVEGADVVALVAMLFNLYMDNCGQKTHDSETQKWQAFADGLISGGMLMSGSVECGTAISDLAAHGLGGGLMGLTFAVGGTLASGFAARDHWRTRRSRLIKCDALDKNLVNSFPRDSHGSQSRHHALLAVKDDDATFDYLVSELSLFAKQFDHGAAGRIAERASTLDGEDEEWRGDACKEEDFRIRHFRYQVGPGSYVWLLPAATSITEASDVEDYIHLLGLKFFENVFFTVGQKQKKPDPTQVALMAKLESSKVTTVFVKRESPNRDVEHYRTEKRKWSRLQCNGKQFKANVIIVGDTHLKALPGGEVLADLLTGSS